MGGRRRLHRYVAWAVIAAAAATIAIALWQFREAIAWRWYLFRNRPLIAQAREQILGWEDFPAPLAKPTGPLGDLLSGGEPGLRAIASLLEDDDPRVWVRTAELIGFDNSYPNVMPPDMLSQVISYLRSRDQRSLLRYLILPPSYPWTGWRAYIIYANGLEEQHWCWYWSGEVGQTLRPAPDGVAFCEDILFDRFSYEGIHFDPGGLKTRAVDALAAMWRPEASSDVRNCQVLAALERFIRLEQDPDLRIHAICRLAMQCGTDEPNEYFPLSLSDWESFAGICPTGGREWIDWNPWGDVDEYLRKFYEPDFIAALIHLDNPRVLRVIARLDRDPSMRERIAAVRLRREPAFPISGPEWFPLDAAVRRLLEGSVAERGQAILCMTESPDREAVEVLRRALAKETVEDLRGLLECCLYSLGEAERAGEAARLLEDWLARDVRDLQGGIQVSGAIGRILRAGDRALLDRVAGEAIRKYRPDLLFALADAIENFPLRNLLLKVSPSNNRWPHLDDLVENEALSAWWQAHRDKLAWDARRRMFIAGE